MPMIPGAMDKLDRSLFSPGDRVLVGVSGGVDSLALLHILHALREELGLELFAAHVHHGMRAEAAEADVEFLQGLCAQWQIPLSITRCDVPALAARQRISVEEAGRNARYEAFDKAA